ncbi:MAG: hypothetical protein P8M65_14815 [Roseibacillus sp.]|nr:hypothetical protein [Roseibacillus sp.]
MPETPSQPDSPLEDPVPANQGAKESDPAQAQNPGAGCIIMIVALSSLAFLIGFGVWSLFKQHREISKFTSTSPQEIPLPDLEANAAAMIQLNASLETFRTEAGNERTATLRLSPEGINLALAAFEDFGELRKTFSVKKITSDEVHIEISFKMRGSPLNSEDYRYLNGTMITKPELSGGEIFFNVDRIEVPGKSVPEGFIGVFSPYRPAQVYLADEDGAGPWMRKLTSLVLEDGFLNLTIEPSDVPPESEPEEIEFGHILRAVILFAAVLLAFIATAIFAFKRSRARS